MSFFASLIAVFFQRDLKNTGKPLFTSLSVIVALVLLMGSQNNNQFTLRETKNECSCTQSSVLIQRITG